LLWQGQVGNGSGFSDSPPGSVVLQQQEEHAGTCDATSSDWPARESNPIARHVSGHAAISKASRIETARRSMFE